jgi:DNA helicase IV
MRRVPAKSLTVVGDLAQTGSAAGARSWGEVLDPYLEGRWRVERLEVNYRTPVEIMRVAADVLRSFAPDEEPPESVREGESEPRALRLPVEALPGVVDEELAAIGEGRLGVLTPDARHARVSALFPGSGLEAPVAVLTVGQAKGLEFDAVVVVDPAGILEQSPMGGQDMYVAVTRATRRLTVVYEDKLPSVLSRLA